MHRAIMTSMNTTNAIKAMMSESGTTATDLSSALGRHRNFVATTLSRGSTPRADTLANMAHAMGYELVLRKAGERDGIVITTED